MASTIKKAQKYDRQLRLWGDHGQEALENGKVCLINATAMGTEILKNIVLPGVGSFTIVDGSAVTEADLGNNFFLSEETLGQNRAKVATELLRELNQDVQGDYVSDSCERVLERDPNFFSAFSVVVATALPETLLLRIAALLWEKSIPFVYARAYGLIGYLRLQIREACVVESHPDDFLADLRLARPFPELVALAEGVDYETMSLRQHSHVPWAVIILKALTEWRAAHDGKLPKNKADKEAFRALIKSKIRQREDRPKYQRFVKQGEKDGLDGEVDMKAVGEAQGEGGEAVEFVGPEDEVNFDEAVKNTNTAVEAPLIPSDVRAILEDPRAANTDLQTSNFWILARALKEFVDAHGVLPVSGAIPDMTADSESYMALQRVYVNKAKEDTAVIASRVQELLAMVGKPAEAIPESDIRLFCKNAAFLKYVQGSSLAAEYDPETFNKGELEFFLEDDNSPLVLYVLLRAVDRFFTSTGHFPGHFDEMIEDDVRNLSGCVSALLSEWGLSCNIKDDFISEACRYGGAELHAVAAFIAGIASQEVIKLISRQYVPLKSTFLFNGMTTTSLQYNF